MAPRKKQNQRNKRIEEQKSQKKAEELKDMQLYESKYEIEMPKMPEFECFSYLSKNLPSALVNNDPKIVSFNSKFRNSVLALLDSGHLKIEDGLAMFGVLEQKSQSGGDNQSLPYGATEQEKIQYIKDKIKHLSPLDHAQMMGHLSLQMQGALDSSFNITPQKSQKLQEISEMRMNFVRVEEQKSTKKKKKKEKLEACEEIDPEDFVQSLKNHPAKNAYLEKKKIMEQEYNFKNPQTNQPIFTPESLDQFYSPELGIQITVDSSETEEKKNVKKSVEKFMNKTKFEATFNIKDGKLNEKVMRDVEEFFSQIEEMEPQPVEQPKTEIIIKEGGKEITLTTFCRNPNPPISEQIRQKSQNYKPFNIAEDPLIQELNDPISSADKEKMMDFLQQYGKIKQMGPQAQDRILSEEDAKIFEKAQKDLKNMFSQALNSEPEKKQIPESEDEESTVISGPVTFPSDFQIREEKELTYAQNIRYQRQFLRFLVSKLHTVNAMTDNVNSIVIPETQNRPKESDSENKMMEYESNLGQVQHRYYSDQRNEMTYMQLYQQVSIQLHMILHHTKIHLSEISQMKSSDIAFAQLQQTPRMQEVSMMLIAALEKLFQAIEYVQFPVKEDLARRMDLQQAENLGLNQINEEIKKLREIMMTDTFYNI